MLNVGLTLMLCRMEFPSIAIDAMRAELVCVPGGSWKHIMSEVGGSDAKRERDHVRHQSAPRNGTVFGLTAAPRHRPGPKVAPDLPILPGARACCTTRSFS